jgi:3-methyl-2-oxobutanoate hydroxymethyltransferase
MSAQNSERKRVTPLALIAKKERGEVITALTAYDYPTAVLLDKQGIDVILVGDSLGMVVLGFDTTLPVTMEDMLHHCRAVTRGTQKSLTVGDMPFMSYQVSVEESVRNAGRLLQEGGVDAVKLEGGREREPAVRAIIAAGIPVMGHLGLTPQSIRQLGSFKPQGDKALVAKRLVEDALILEEAGCFSIVLESVPARLATFISQRLKIPTIGIGAGNGCDGQILVTQDMLGLSDGFKPRFVKTYADLHGVISQAVEQYKKEVEIREYPDQNHSVEMPEEEWLSFLEQIQK